MFTFVSLTWFDGVNIPDDILSRGKRGREGWEKERDGAENKSEKMDYLEIWGDLEDVSVYLCV